MPSDKFAWQARVKAVEREHTATRFALDYLQAAVDRDPSSLAGYMRIRELREAAQRLEGTYIIRLFAEFETCLRQYWEMARGRQAPSRTRNLLDGVGARCVIPHDQIRNAHAVRAYRNSLVHEAEDVDVEPIPISKTRHHLCHYLSFLPPPPVAW